MSKAEQIGLLVFPKIERMLLLGGVLSRWTRLCFAALALMSGASAASAQSASSIINLFNGVIGTAIAQAAMAEWRKLRPDELQCVDQRLRQTGLSLESAIRQGILPTDARLMSVRRGCGNEAAQTSPSFDCGRVTLPDERAICTNPELARLDRLMAAGYSDVRALKGEQLARTLGLQLLRYRRACGADVDCIREAQLSAIKVYREHGASVELAEAFPRQQVPSIYSVDGFSVGSNAFQNAGPLIDYSCNPSAQFVLLTSCERKKVETVQRGKFTSTYNLMYAQDGRVAFASRTLEPAWFAGDEAKDDIGRLAKKYRHQPTILQMTDNQEGLKGTIATWGDISLRPLTVDRREALLNGKERRMGIWVDYLGNLFRSLQLRLPVYEVTGAAGFVWSASWNGAGIGVLKFFAADPGALSNVSSATKLDTSVAKAEELNRKFKELLARAKSGDNDAARAVSEAYLNGNGVEKDFTEAIRWLKTLVEKGNTPAQGKLASMMLEGKVIPKDEKTALDLFKEAAAKNDPEAIYTVGRIYDRGNGTAVNSAEAFTWFEKAAALGSSPASERIKEGQKITAAARIARNKLDDSLSWIKADGLQRRVLDQSVALAIANEHMSYSELAKTRQTIEAANRQIIELEDLDRISKLANGLVKKVEDDLKKITSDAPIVNQLRLGIADVQRTIAAQDLASLQSAMGNLDRLYKANLARLHEMEFKTP